MEYAKFNVLKLALAAGIYCAFIFFMSTLLAMLQVGGLVEFAQTLERYYGPWGYSVSPKGLLVGILYGFQEGFMHFGLFALLYNKLLPSSKTSEPKN
jgi:hypothetical protein